MISIILPTFNRAYALKDVLPTFYEQKEVFEIVIIDDCSSDDTERVINDISNGHQHVKTIYHKNSENQGASICRQTGVKLSSGKFILFCDDDDFLEKNYSEVCLSKMLETGAAIVSGRHFYREPGESLIESINRFKNGTEKKRVFNKVRFSLNLNAIVQNDHIELPFTHGIFMIRRDLIDLDIWDTYYSKGNGFREESDYQMRLFSEGKRIIMVNQTHSIHMHQSEVKSGGQRVNRISRFYWTILYTFYFLDKYFNKTRDQLKIPYPKIVAKCLYLLIETYYFFLRPIFLIPERALKGKR